MIEIQFNSFPKHKINLIDDNGFIKDSVELDDGFKALREATRQDNAFDDIKLQRTLKVACDLFKPTKIRIKPNE